MTGSNRQDYGPNPHRGLTAMIGFDLETGGPPVRVDLVNGKALRGLIGALGEGGGVLTLIRIDRPGGGFSVVPWHAVACITPLEPDTDEE